jgi:hypothetical protein
MSQLGTSAIPVRTQRGLDTPEANSSGVSWPAVFGGAFVTAALFLILLSLGAGLGLSSTSIWSNMGASATRIGTASILWLIFAEIVCSAMGGYLAGRLRTKWTAIHGDEVYFRDTAHGFLSWSVALVVTAAFLGSAATSMVGASGTPEAAANKANPSPNAYFVDALLRPNASQPDASQPAATDSVRQEVAIIFAVSMKQGGLSDDDKAYLGQLVSARTGLDTDSADKRVSDIYANALRAADTARKDLAHTLLWIFIALLIGAFCASLAGTIGGRQRDNVVII